MASLIWRIFTRSYYGIHLGSKFLFGQQLKSTKEDDNKENDEVFSPNQLDDDVKDESLTMKHTKHHHSSSKRRIFKKHQGRSNNNSPRLSSSSSSECHQDVASNEIVFENKSGCANAFDISKPCPLAQDEIALSDQAEAETSAAASSANSVCVSSAKAIVKEDVEINASQEIETTENTHENQQVIQQKSSVSKGSTDDCVDSFKNLTIDTFVCSNVASSTCFLSGEDQPLTNDMDYKDGARTIAKNVDKVTEDEGSVTESLNDRCVELSLTPKLFDKQTRELSEVVSSVDGNEIVTASCESEFQLSSRPQTLNLTTKQNEEMSNSQTSLVALEARLDDKPMVVSGGICQLVEESLGELYGLSCLDVTAKRILTRQARDLLVCHYFGSLFDFHNEFLQPASQLLKKLKENEWKSLLTLEQLGEKNSRSPEFSVIEELPSSKESLLLRERSEERTSCSLSCSCCWLCGGWPLRLGRNICVSLGELEPALLRSGDYYLCVRPKKPGVDLVLKYFLKTGFDDDTLSSCVKEHVIKESDFGRLFNAMEGKINPPAEMSDAVSDEQMTALLQHMLVSVEKGIKRMRWELQSTTLEWAKKLTLSRDSMENIKDDENNQKMASSTAAGVNSGCCCNLLCVNVKDSSVQTTPLEEQKHLCSSAADVNSCNKIAPKCSEEDVKKTIDSKLDADSNNQLTDGCYASATNLGTSKNELDILELTTKDNERQEMVSGSKESLDVGHLTRAVNPPVLFGGVHEEIIKLQAALIPGCRDRTGRIVVIVNCGLLHNCHEATAPVLAQLFVYYHSVPRKELAARGFLILVDARNAVNETYTLLDEAFCQLEGCISGAINTVVIWKAGNSFAGTDTSPRKIPTPFPKSAVKFEVVYVAEEVGKVIKSDQLPTEIGGEYAYDHQRWMDFRMKLEPFTQNCRTVGKQLIGIMQEMKSTSVPSSVNLSTQSIERHKKFISQVFDDLQLVHLQQTAPETITELEEIRRQFPNNHDFREAVEKSNALYGELQRAVVKLVRLADKRLRKLEQCLQLRTLEEETNQVLSWLSKKGEEILNKHSIVANSLGGVKAQERDFEKFYFLAMRNIEKGNDLLEEATLLGQKGTCEAAGMKELATSLKQHLGSFSSRLEEQREKLEDTSKCYQLLDKAYEWALEAMKFVSRLKMDQYMTPDQLACLMKHLHNYLENHQPLSDETFVEMIELATKLSNERLLEQCKVAQMRCQETAELIRTRQQTLLKVKQQMEAELSRQRQLHQDQLLDQVSDVSVVRSCKDYTQSSSPLWTPFTTSSPCYPYARRRSVSGLPYNLTTSPSSFFGVPCQPSHKRHDSFGAKMLISEEQDENGDLMDSGIICNDMIVHADEDCFELSPQASNVKDGEEKSSCRETNSSIENSKIAGVLSCGTDTEAATSNSSMSSGPTCGKKIMKRSLTWQFEDDSWDILPARPSCGYGQLNKTLPHRGSAESIPSITENEDSGLNQSSSKLGSGYPPVPVNSHLHQRGSSLNLQFAATSMADLRPSTEQLKQRKTALLIMREMIQTERDYVKSLEYIIENYVPELLRDDIPQALRGKRNVIFGNIEKIYEFHNRYFLQELEQCENSPSQVGQCFLYHDSQFYLYALYNKNKPNSDTLMAEYGSTFFKSKQLELGDKMDLASYLLKPVQRMGKYALLLKQLLKECVEKDPEYATLTAAKDMVNFQLRHGNDLLAMDAIRECDVNLKEQGCLIRQDEFLGWQGKSRKCLRQVFLFEDLILFSKARRDPAKKGHDIYQYKNSFKMSDIGLTEQIGESTTKFEIWFRKRKISDTYTLQSPSPEIRQNWVQDISKLLWKQALRNREIRLAELSSMGIGNKPCLDIKPSQDQISDRSISISQLNKAPKFRNSIGSISSDYLRNNKRPHSIISISSSSSGSSHSSTGPFFGALNLGFDPSDSPKSHHRSVTQQSQCSSESGIIPDISINYYNLTDNERHSKVERSNSNTSNDSIGACSLSRSPSTPMSPEEEEDEEEDVVEVESTIETGD